MAAHASVFVLIALACLVTVFRGRWEPAIALILGAGALGAFSGLSVGQIGKSFGNGFGAAAGTVGLAVLAASLVGCMADSAGAAAGLGAGWRRWLLPGFGVLAGIGVSPQAGFAVLTPLREGYCGAIAPRGAIRLGLAISAGQGGILPSPALVAATTILGADWRRVLALGLPLSLAVIACMWWLTRAVPDSQAVESRPPGSARAGAALLAASAAMIALLGLASLGNIPSEPFGGGSTREFLLGAGRPFILLVVGGAIMLAAMRPSRALRGFGRNGFAGAAVARAAPLIALLGAAGGLQSVAQDTHLADTLAEAASFWHAGLLVPFAVAAAMKFFQGSSLVAAITASGLVQPVLAQLGVDDVWGRACAALAVGVGAMAGCCITDSLFWLVVEGGRLRGRQALGWVTLGSLVQGAAVVAALQIVRKSLLFL